MVTPIENLTAVANKLGVLPISKVILDASRFPIWSGSSHKSNHHYGKGGLAEHTYEVVQLCLLNNSFFEGIWWKHVQNVPSLFLAALFHDAGKMWDYKPLNDEFTLWGPDHHKRIVHHITRSAIVWSMAKHDFKYDDPDDDVLHAIIAHHGCRQWGSPVTPLTNMAWLLHLCDSISARMDDCRFRDMTHNSPTF